eukprot:TRINITY_DN11304_c0_g1_i1.p1 TRINITY_DN11304_c0_g1~~TRINITY_DN11304_c0_g1_i1.p1  ORF type:complete len:1431 (+),score=452.89 TRINITY_DN11304_c0_g1_i1:1321-5613(+)
MRKLFTVDHGTNGKGSVCFGWNRGGNLLACCGVNRKLTVWDRQGKVIDQKTLSHPGACMGLEWDSSGETIAVMQQGSPIIVLWHYSGKKLENLETGLKDLTFLKWNKCGPQLAVGTLKGNLLLYNKKTLKKMSAMGKHTKKITCGAWSTTGKLALAGEDRVLSINTSEGDLIDQIQLKLEPVNVQFARMKSEGVTNPNDDEETTISVNMGGKTLLLYDTTEASESPYELAFLPKYGTIMSYRWFGDGYILVGFSSGQVIVISTHLKEIGQEVSYVVPHSDQLGDVAYCPSLQKGASIGDNCVQLFGMEELQNIKARDSDKYDLDSEYGALQKIEWTEDGQILTVSSRNGNVHTLLTKIPVMNDAYGTRVLYLTSLREVCVKDILAEQEVVNISVEVEPTFVSLGPNHAAVGMNNCVWYYHLPERGITGTQAATKVTQRTYAYSVEQVKLSMEYAAVISEGKVTLHVIDTLDSEGMRSDMDERMQQKVFPEKEGDTRITSVAMSPKFMMYSTNQGSIVYFSLDDWTIISEYRTPIGIRSIFPNTEGTRLAFMDDANDAYIYSPVDDSLCKVDQFNVNTDKLLWDSSDWGVFIGCDTKHFTTYVYSPNTRWGPKCGPVCTSLPGKPVTDEVKVTDKPAHFTPILVHNGGAVCQMGNGTMPIVSLNTHVNATVSNRVVGDQVQQAFHNCLSLNRLDAAWSYAQRLSTQDCWYLADRALHLLDIPMAIRVYRMVQQPAMVLALDKLLHVSEKTLLLGHVAMLFKNFNEAQNHFMKSSNPKLALEMRRNLMHWNEALELSEKMAPEEIPYISKEYATQLEFKGELQPALDMYNRGAISIDPSVDEQKRRELHLHNEQCQAGIARITIRMGDITRGFQIAMQTEAPSLAVECAQIFEELKQWTEAAQLYEQAENFNKAAEIYICQNKNLKAAATLMPRINSHRIQGLYGAAKEHDKDYEAAKQAYLAAEDWDNVVRLLVEHLNDISSAYDVVRRTKSAEAAALVAKRCQKDGNPETAIEFLLLAKKTEEAFELASLHDHMHTYASVLSSNGSVEDYLAIANYYEEKGKNNTAGDYYLKCKRYDKALQKYLDMVSTLEQGIHRAEDEESRVKQTDVCINKAIEVVGEAQNDKLNKVLITFLTTDEDSQVPRDPKYLFSLYMALGKYDKGCGMAIVIARREQKMGHYRIAHRLLFQTYKDLEKHGITIPSELRWNLMLLHSYLIAKPLMKALQDHEKASRMLIRVAKNIPKFPKHVVPILTSCVTECNKAGFDKSAYHYAKELVTSDRKEIPEKHRKRMDTIVRKPGYYSKDNNGKKKTEADLTDPPEPVGPCPFCNTAVPMTMLDCPRCKNNVPYCIATGQHMLLSEWSSCPNCKFPALFGPYSEMVRQGEPCMMCEEVVDIKDVKKIQNPNPRDWLNSSSVAEQPAEEPPTGAEQS